MNPGTFWRNSQNGRTACLLRIDQGRVEYQYVGVEESAEYYSIREQTFVERFTQLPIEYAGQPDSVGVYACRVPMIEEPSLLEDLFLMWDGKKWFYLMSDQECRREVKKCLGPLARK